MSSQATPSDFYTVSTTPGTPVPLGPADRKMQTLTLGGWKSPGVPNVGTVKVRPVGGSGWRLIEPETEIQIPIPAGSFLRASQLELDVITTGDGVLGNYASAVIYEGP